jgi:hypothetical protein
MQARRVELGDLMQSPSLDLVGDLPSGRGVLVDNYSIGYRSKFATRSFRGRLPDGWTVELYQNNSLTGVQKSRSDGLYEFNDIPLRFGLNLFRFVFHGPMGERREETYRADIESDLPLPGTFQYRLAGVKPDDPEMEGDFMESSREIESAREQPTYMADGDYGLSRFFALNTGLARTHLEDGAHQYRVLGLRGLFSYLSFQTSLAQDLGPGSSKGRSIEGIVRSGFGYSSISLRRADYRDGFQQIHVPQDVIVDTPLRSETELDLFGTLNVKDHPVGLSFNHEVSEYDEGERTSTDELKATFNLANWSISPSLTRISRSEQQGPVPLDFAVFASSFGAMTAFQGGLDAQRKGGDFTLTGWQAALDITAVSGIVYRIGIRGSDSTLENATVLGSLNKLSGDVGYGVDAQYSQSDGYTLSLRVQASFAREPRTRRWTSSAQPMAGLGSISTVAFLDANGNQILDSKEEILEGAQFKVGGLPVESALKDPQVVFKPQLPRGQETPVQLIESSLEDPAMQPTVSGIRIVPRAGRVSCVEIPVARFGEIVGTTRIRREEGIQEYGGLELELMKASGEQVRIFRSSYDGFFEIRNLPLGNYVLRVAPQEVSRLKLKQPPVRTFTIDSEKNLFEGQDFIVEQVLSVPATSTLEVTP